ncbi:MAG: lysophospholipid acyltransferase family protein [Gemmataceae bacterium]
MSAEPRTIRRDANIPPPWLWLQRKFIGYCHRFVRKNFHAVRLSRQSAPLPNDGQPVLIVLNHPGWWDPMICTVLAPLWPAGACQYAIMDAAQLERYWLLKKVGFLGIDPRSRQGAIRFLSIGQQVLQKPNHILWVTAQGRFADVRERPLNLRSGVGHLASRLSAGWIVPLAMEYAFGHEKRPEAFARWGTPLAISSQQQSAKDWTQTIETALTTTLDTLNAEVIQRDLAAFDPLLARRNRHG